MTMTAQSAAEAIRRQITDTYRAQTDHPMHDALEHVELLRRTIGELTDVLAGDVLVARVNGASWQDIGNALGTTKQAAHERFGA